MNQPYITISLCIETSQVKFIAKYRIASSDSFPTDYSMKEKPFRYLNKRSLISTKEEQKPTP